MAFHVPVVHGMVLLMGSTNDFRKELTLILLGFLFVSMVLANFLHIPENLLTTLTAAITTLLGYWFGKKEREIEGK